MPHYGISINYLTQIVGLNGVPVRDFQHSDVVKMFQSSEELSITVLPSSLKTVGIDCDVLYCLDSFW